MNNLTNKNILLGVTGGIAAYKCAELVRLLKKAGADVQVVVTETAQQFITPLTLETLSGRPVYSSWDEIEAGIGHIELARWADRILIAPATADTLARLVQGNGAQLLDAMCLASEAPLFVAPAMNRVMWESQATQENLRVLIDRGVTLLGPDEGAQACGETGPGRMLEPQALCQSLDGSFENDRLAGVNILVTAGPTQESLDPVRCLTNHSSGKTGYAIAIAAKNAGANVTLVSGPVALPLPEKMTVISVISAAQMHESVMNYAQEADIFIATAAVSDYRPVRVSEHKIKKNLATIQLELEKTEDILATVAALKNAPYCVGFAAETENVEGNAQSKRIAKSIDVIVANRVGNGRAFGADTNQWQVYWGNGVQEFPDLPKTRLAEQLVVLIAQLFNEHRDKPS